MGPVHIRPVVDPNDVHDALILDVVEHPVRSASGRVETGELERERLAEAPWILQKRSCHKLDDRSCRKLGQTSE